MEERTSIIEVLLDGEPKAPKGVKKTLVNQYGYYVRENILISFMLWKKSKATDNDVDAVPNTEKEMLWREVKMHCDFPNDKEEVLKKWVMKKMAISFRTFKKNMNTDYVQQGLTSNIDEHLKKQRPYWNASCNISCRRTARSEQEGIKKMQAKSSISIIMGKEVIRRQF
jgi:hypothetical protein